MKALEKIINKFKPALEKGGKYHKFQRSFEAFETFLLVPDRVTTKGSHIRDTMDMKRTMFFVVIALMPALLFGMWNVGYQHYNAIGMTDTSLIENFMFGLIKVFPIIVVSYVVGLGTEFIFATVRDHEVNEGFLVTGMLIPLIVPVTTPLWMIALATIFAVIIGKEVFGGTGMNIVNPALLARAFLFFSYPAYFSGEVYTYTVLQEGQQLIDGFSGATPLAFGALAVGGQMSAAEFSGSLPSIMEMFIGNMPGVIGETSTLAILIGAFILVYTGIGSLRIMLSVVIGGLFMGALLNLFAVNPFMEMPAYYHLMLGGFAFGAVFMATDPVSAAQTGIGKYIYGFLIGVIAIIIRVLNPAFPEGMMLAILFMNIFAPLIDHYVIQANVKRRMKRYKASQIKV
ncbi:MAG: NADH:ubiquinone reductase (Na(+)-transporting) subunit B [Bacteroidota bacterium]